VGGAISSSLAAASD
jgi:hypothetical protein